MHVGLLTIRLMVSQAKSLKDKRRVVKSLKDRIHNTFNASVAEIESLDNRQKAVLGVAVVANDGRFINSVLSKIIDFVRRRPGAELVDYDLEIL
jgi:uncharacterized protein YlxP (DUF503 family)